MAPISIFAGLGSGIHFLGGVTGALREIRLPAAVLGWAPTLGAASHQTTPGMAPLPATPPIGGVVWTVVVPAILFLGSFLGTYLLYRRFSKQEEES